MWAWDEIYNYRLHVEIKYPKYHTQGYHLQNKKYRLVLSALSIPVVLISFKMFLLGSPCLIELDLIPKCRTEEDLERRERLTLSRMSVEFFRECILLNFQLNFMQNVLNFPNEDQGNQRIHQTEKNCLINLYHYLERRLGIQTFLVFSNSPRKAEKSA